MIAFIIIISVSSLIGIQAGVYLLLKEKSITSGYAFLFSFIIYLIPILIITAHIDLYKNRHTAIKDLSKRLDFNQQKLDGILKIIDTKRFLVFSIIMMIKDLVTPKDNLILIIGVAEIYNNKITSKTRNDIRRRRGTVGVIKKVTEILMGNFVTHATEQFNLKKIRLG